MILTETVKIKPSGRSIQYYKDKGYDVKWHEELEVNVSDLPNNSFCEIKVQCDNPNCKHIHTIQYLKYIKNIKHNNGLYLCKDCWSERLSLIINKKYGVNNISKLEEIKQKKILTSLKNFGVEYPLQSFKIMNKVKEKVKSIYGVENAMQSKEVLERAIQTNYQKYGYKNPMQNNEIKKKAQLTNIERYGGISSSCSLDVQEKTRNTMYLNSTCRTSNQQRYFYNIYKSNYFQSELNYPIGKKFSGDIVINNLDIEIDYGGHILEVIKGNMSQEEFNQKELIRDKIVKSEGYKVVRIKSYNSRKVPTESKLLEILSYTIDFFNSNPDRSWITFDIDNSCIYNAYHKDGLPFNFGELKTIRNK